MSFVIDGKYMAAIRVLLIAANIFETFVNFTFKFVKNFYILKQV